MKMFMLKVSLIASLMFVSVLVGMQHANGGIHKMKGYEDSGFRGAFIVNEADQGEYQATVLGNDISSHDLEEKKAKLEKMKAYNFFSDMGKKAANGITAAAKKLFDSIAGLIESS
ncbi:DUF3679 domain-containing protein [Bacillus sp. V33-4]|uniref:DUF3679 domain-containing protein n=1 Tax=Bacillus sp. V33-4 TaxID=2054169 RepID=UPI000C762011|nr:DUF3679 domain-containing protein [Bacillus sp. V33-4]PLR87656.1 DUF3679 domain-containing protein [Bacillus sp. V33-4]